MRLNMTAFLLPSFRLLLGLLTLTFLVACGSDETKSKKSDEIDTEHLYFSNNSIYSFEPGSSKSKTGKSIKRASYNEGTRPIKLNTNKDKQGYEFIAFVQGKKVKLINYVDMKITTLATIDQNAINSKVCGLYPQEQVSFQEQGALQVTPQPTIFHDSSVIIEISTTETCADSTVSLVNFTINSDGEIKTSNPDDDIEISSIIQSTNAKDIIDQPNTQPELDGDLVVDQAYSKYNAELNETVTGRYATLAADNKASPQFSQLIHYDENYDIKWQLPLGSPGDTIKVTQINTTQVLISVGNKLFIKNIEELLSSGTVDTNNIPISNINELFVEDEETKIPTISQPDYNLVSNENNLIVNDDGKLFHFEKPSFKPNPEPIFNSNTKPDLESFKFDITDNSTTVIQQNLTDKKSISLKLASASDFTDPEGDISNIQNFFIQGNQLFINAFIAPDENDKPTNFLEAEATAYFIEINEHSTLFIPKVFEHSQFIKPSDTRSSTSDILLLSSEVVNVNDVKTPQLYKFDADQSNGRKQARSDEKGNKVKIDLSFGQLIGNKDMPSLDTGEELLNEIYLDSMLGTITNDIHGQLQVETAVEFLDDDNNVAYRRVSDLYFFKPNQSNPDDEDRTLRYIVTHSN